MTVNKNQYWWKHTTNSSGKECAILFRHNEDGSSTFQMEIDTEGLDGFLLIKFLESELDRFFKDKFSLP